jgi:hypothetical protein
MSDSRLDPRKEHDFGVPKNGDWCFNLKAMLANAPEGAFIVAWDTPPTDSKPNGAKCYGSYESPEQCYEELSKTDLKCCYEVFVRGDNYSNYPTRSPCIAYGDLEWVGDEDKEHLCARKLLRRLFNVCQTKLGFTPEVYVLCGTRETKDGIKNSYHVKIANCWAKTCEHIKQLYLPETLRTGDEDDLKEYDQAVYAKTQLIRMPLCSKRGTKVPLRRINADPHDPEDTLTAKFEDDDFAAIRPALVTVFDKTKPTMYLLKPYTLVPKPEPKSLNSTGKKRSSSQASLDTAGRDDARPRPNSTLVTSSRVYSLQSASDVFDLLVAMHPVQIGHGYDSWRDMVFGVLNEAGNSPEVVNALKEWTRIRPKDDHRDPEWARIVAGSFASKERRSGDGGTISMGSLVFNQQEYPAACTFIRVSNGDPLPNCRARLAPEDVWLFELFEMFLRHVKYQETSFKWLVQFASYVVPKLKDQVYDTIQGGYEDITKKDFDLVWDGGQYSEIYEFACKRYLADIVGGINSHTPLFITNAGGPGGDTTVDDSSNPHEAVATVSHIKAPKPKAQGRQSKRFTKEEVVAWIVKISPNVHSLHPVEVITKAVRGSLKEHTDVEEEAAQLVEQWKSLQGKQPDTGPQREDGVRDQDSMEVTSEEHSDCESMEVTFEEHTSGESAEATSDEQNDDESMEGGAVDYSQDVVMTDRQALSDGGDKEEFKSLQELASSHPNLVWNPVITTASRRDSPETKMLKVFLENLDRRQVTNDLTLIRTCCLLQMSRADDPQIQGDTFPEELFNFLKAWSENQGLRFDDNAAKRVKTAWGCAWEDIKKGAEWELFADALWLEIFNNLFSYEAVKHKFEESNFKVTDLSCYASITSDGRPTPRKQADLNTNYCNLWCWIRVVTPASDEEEEEQVEFKSMKFLPPWFNDENMRTYTKFDCIAPSKSGHVVPPDVFNTWPGFKAEKLPGIPDDEVAGLIEPIMQHLRVVICSTEEQVQYQLAWWAQQVQDPANKTGVGIIYMGDQGVGKDIVTEFVVEKVFGTDVATQCDEVTHLFEKHSLERENKVFCVLDEASGATIKPYIPNIKATMVAPRMSFNAKFGGIYKLLCIINYMFTSNDTLPMPIEASDRRMVVFQCNNSKKGNTGYFNALGRALANPRTARAFFQFLQNFDLSDYGNFQAKRPETAMYRRLKEMAIPLFYNFLSFQCGQQALKYSVHGATFIFDGLKKWADEANIDRRSYTFTRLGLDFSYLMENYADHGVTKKKTCKGNQYSFEWAKLEACLKHYNLFNSNVI